MSEGSGTAGPPHVHADASGSAWSLHWNNTRFDVRLTDGALVCDYLGPELAAPPTPLWAGWREWEIARNAGARALAQVGARPVSAHWRLEGWETPAPGRLAVSLLAEQEPLACEVTFTVDPATGVLSRATVLRHAGGTGAADIPVASALSLWVALRGEMEEVTVLAGRWGAEGQVRTWHDVPLALAMESRAGKTGFEYQPWLMARTRDGTYLCALGWSGNWMLHAQLRPGSATLAGGLNEWGFQHVLAPGTELRLPEAVLAYVHGDAGLAVRRLHDWRRARRPDADRPVPVQFNTWFVCDETPDAARLRALIPAAARLGCETFVLDAGWAASVDGDPDENWYLRVGDWAVDRRRFPGGLRVIGDACAAAGMAFGIWCEPEAVGPRARLRRSRPEWMHHLDGVPPAPGERAYLHLGVPGAWAHARDMLCRLIADTGARWLKWDFNADIGAGGWAPGLPEALTRQDPLVAHYEGLYRLQDAVRAAFPGLVLEMCATGGSRMDAAILSRAHVAWLSDQPQAVAKLAIHFGMQMAHPAVCCNDWLVDWPPRAHKGVAEIDRRGDLEFRLRVAMLGSFGISAAVDGWSAADRDVAAAHVALYRDRIRVLVQHGDQYQLTPPPPLSGEGDWAAMWYVAKDGGSGVLFAFRLQGTAEREFPLPGLRGGKRHISGDGGALDGEGARVRLGAEYSSALLIVEAEAGPSGHPADPG